MLFDRTHVYISLKKSYGFSLPSELAEVGLMRYACWELSKTQEGFSYGLTPTLQNKELRYENVNTQRALSTVHLR